MSDENKDQSPEGAEGREARGGEPRGGVGRSLPRLFSEMPNPSSDREEGGAGADVGAGDEGGAGREEVWDGPRESIGEPGRAGEVADEGARDGAAGEDAEDFAMDEDYVSPALAARRKGSPKKKLRPFEVKLGPAEVGLTAEQRMLVLDTWLRSELPAREF